jgi:hypothetical protein
MEENLKLVPLFDLKNLGLLDTLKAKPCANLENIDHPHNIHYRLVGTMVNDGSIWPFTLGRCMVHNCSHGPSMSDHLGLPTTTLLKVEPFAHVK